MSGLLAAVSNTPDAAFAIRLLVAVAAGAIIGLERQWRQSMAGLRTNALVSAGACLFVFLSGALDDPSPTRVAAQVVSGVGFLGAGVIMRDGLSVRGINTAATLWCSAAVGCLAGSGLTLSALVGALIITATHLTLRPVGHRIDHSVETEDDL